MARGIACQRWAGPFLLATLAALSGASACAAQERMVLGPRQFESDPKGAVLCSWGIYLAVQAQTAICALPRRPSDDAIDQAVAAIDDFIIANSSLHPTRAMLDDFKRRAAESNRASMQRAGLDKACGRSDIELFRKQSPERIAASVKDLLAVPREPVMNPCL